MAKFIAILLIALVAIPLTTAKNSTSISCINHLNIDTFTQGGILEFSSSNVQRIENSTNNCDSVILRDYTGRPLKALQLKIIVGNRNGMLKLTSVSRGSSIPISSFLFDYQIYRGEVREDGSSIDEVKIVILGNGDNALIPGQIHNILCVNYDVVSIESDYDTTSITLCDVLGATSTPVQDANLITGDEKILYLTKSESMSESNVVLEQNYPNPFNPNTRIQYSVSRNEYVVLKVYDVLGNEIETLVNEKKAPGIYKIDWNAANMPSGIYLYQVNTAGGNFMKKMILIK